MTTHHTKDGRDFAIRRPIVEDASRIIDYSKLVFSSTDQLLTLPEEYSMTDEQEKNWINNANKNPDALVLVAEMNDQIVGFLFFFPIPKRKAAHIGEFGVNVHPAFQKLGIGRKLTEALLEWARKNARIEKVFLNVFASNDKAIQLYRNLGFREEGRFLYAAKQITGEYVDIIQMYIDTR
jgi:RimJ/RimL family protein N-acetyltransferase